MVGLKFTGGFLLYYNVLGKNEKYLILFKNLIQKTFNNRLCTKRDSERRTISSIGIPFFLGGHNRKRPPFNLFCHESFPCSIRVCKQESCVLI